MKSSFHVKDLLDLPEQQHKQAHQSLETTGSPLDLPAVGSEVSHPVVSSGPDMTVTPLQTAVLPHVPTLTSQYPTEENSHIAMTSSLMPTGMSHTDSLGGGHHSTGYHHHYMLQQSSLCDQDNPYTRWLHTNGSNPYQGR